VVTDLALSRRFYDAVATALGLQTIDNGDQAFLLGRSAEQPIPYLWIGTIRPSYWVEGSRAGLNQSHIAFVAPSKRRCRCILSSGLGAWREGQCSPGERPGAGEYYGAFVLDPAANNIEVCVRGLAAR
jgi:hypothetical protein